MTNDADSEIYSDIARLYSGEPSPYAQTPTITDSEVDEFIMITNPTTQQSNHIDDAEVDRLLARIPGSWLGAEATDKASRQEIERAMDSVDITPIRNLADLSRVLRIVDGEEVDEYKDLLEVLIAIVVGMMWIFCLWKFGRSAWEDE